MINLKVRKYLTITAIILVSLYLILYLFSFLFEVKTENNSSRYKTEGSFYKVAVENIRSFEWISSTQILLLSSESEKLNLIIFDTHTNSKTLLKSIDTQNVALGSFEGKTILCTWQSLERKDTSMPASRIFIYDYISEEVLFDINLFQSTRIDDCSDGVLELSEFSPVLQPLHLYYDYVKGDFVETKPESYQLEGVVETLVNYKDQNVFRFDFPNKFRKVRVSDDNLSVALLDYNNQILIFTKP